MSMCQCPSCGNVFYQEEQPKDVFIPNRLKRAFEIIEIVCHEYEVTETQIRSRSRKRDITAARHLIMYFIYTYCRYSYKTIADFLKRNDHTSIMHATKRVRDAMYTKTDLYETFTRLNGPISELFEAQIQLSKAS